ncbi:ankyrin repeat domain-containing protein 26 [Limosa lapponica baueri]|uniref:Ankyrin repeat domain-containing protein 26 n=1 Tax=Limosa lapponica baueri TaxID=1758121 RepID=A0A2I0UMD2_LIMLA|nr:ankyrin repeat domain-containing protein 26 [Limosa lapponica baueri]
MLMQHHFFRDGSGSSSLTSLAEASLEAKKRYSRDLREQKRQLQKELDRSKSKLQELKERHIWTECYAESVKKAIKDKERELRTSSNLQGLLAASSGTVAILELEKHMQRPFQFEPSYHHALCCFMHTSSSLTFLCRTPDTIPEAF